MNLGTKSCLHCGKEIQMKIKRDLTRKKYCSYSCRQLYRFSNEQVKLEHMEKMWAKSCTPEANNKKGHKDEKNPKYKKDRSTLKFRDRNGNPAWRKAVFERDNYTCQECGQYGGKLQADHIKPYCLFPELRTDINNGRTLCLDCHKKTDTYGAKALKYKEKSHSV